MEYRFNTPLNGNIAMTYHYHEDAALRRDKACINSYGYKVARWI